MGIDSIFSDAKYVAEDGLQIYLVVQLVFKNFQTSTDSDKHFAWKCNGLSEDSIKTPVTSDNSFAPKLTFVYNGKIGAKFKGNCLIQDNKISFIHRYVINLFYICELDT